MQETVKEQVREQGSVRAQEQAQEWARVRHPVQAKVPVPASSLHRRPRSPSSRRRSTTQRVPQVG